MPDNKRKLYEYLSKKYDIGTFEAFSQKIVQPNFLRKAYGEISQEFDVGDFPGFVNALGIQMPKPPPTKADIPITLPFGRGGLKVTPRQIGTAIEVAPPVAAAFIPPPFDVPAVGAASLAGTAAKQIFLREFGEEESPEEKRQELLISGALGLGGQGAFRLLSKARAPFAKQVDQPTARFAEKYGLKLTPSEMLKEATVPSSLLEVFEDVAERSIFGAPILRKFKVGRFEKLVEAGQSAADEIAKLEDPDILKGLIVSERGESKLLYDKIVGREYRKLDKLAAAKIQGQTITRKEQSILVTEKGIPFMKDVTEEIPRAVDVSALIGNAKNILQRLPEKERIAASGAGAEASAYVQQLERIASLPKYITFEHAVFYRSQLLAARRLDKSIIGSQVSGSAEHFAGILDNRMAKAAQSAGEDVYTQWRHANALVKKGHELFDKSFIARLAELEPLKVGQEILRSGSLNRARLVRQVTTPETFQKIKRATLEDILTSKRVLQIGQTGDELLQARAALLDWRALKPKFLAEIFTAEERGAVEGFLNLALKAPTGKRAIGSIGLLVAMGAVGGVVGFRAGGEAGAGLGVAGTILLGPAAFAKLVTSNYGRRLLTVGRKTPPGTAAAIQLFVRINKFLGEERSKEVLIEEPRE